MLRVIPALLLAFGLPLYAGVQFAAGPAGGFAGPVSGNIKRYQSSYGLAFDVRVTGFRPIVGAGVCAAYARFKGPKSDSLPADSSRFNYRYLPFALYAFTDLSRIFERSPVLPYLRIGAGPCFWDLRYDTTRFMTLDSTMSYHHDWLLLAGLGAEYKIPSLPLAVALDINADYITSTHFEKYGPYDKDELFAMISLGLRYRLR
jgi:hypothetical protein